MTEVEDGAAEKEKPKPSLKDALNCRAKFAEIRKLQEEKLAADLPDPWVTRKLAVAFVVAFFGYALYVFLVRILIPMIRRDDDARGSRTEGIVLLVFWCLLWIMFVWTYLRVIFTPPGYAKDYIKETPEPEPYDYDGDYSSSGSSSVSSYSTGVVPGPPYDGKGANGTAHGDLELTERGKASEKEGDKGVPPDSAAREQLDGHADPSDQLPPRHDADLIAEQEPAAGAVGPALGQALLSSASEPPAPTEEPVQPTYTEQEAATSFPEPPDGYSTRSESPGPQRRPAPFAVLSESYRYCTRCHIVKPYRAHHCRHCGTCVLKMDHHCPWVGSCVGAHNYKYFYNFLQWSTIFCLYVFLASLLAVVPPSRPAGTSTSVDGRQISLVVIAAFFAMFTGGLLATHTYLICRNISTIEEMAITRNKKRENAVLQARFGWFDFKGRSLTRKRWDKEWGGPHKEGNLWWLGDSRKNWETVMGRSWPGWFLPLAARDGDKGLHYDINPRFTELGRQRRREQWPEELRA